MVILPFCDENCLIFSHFIVGKENSLGKSVYLVIVLCARMRKFGLLFDLMLQELTFYSALWAVKSFCPLKPGTGVCVGY